MFLIVGLGNPGLRYKDTRHNIGFQVVELLSERWGIRLAYRSQAARWGRGHYGSQEVVLAQPDTYMNLSGKAVRRLVEHFALDLSQLLIIHDDLDMPLGRLKFVPQGGAGGHRGVASIIATLGHQNFLRLKIGIGRPQFGEPVETYVLSPCYSFEREAYVVIRERAAEAVETLLQAGLGQAMSQFHKAVKLPVELREGVSRNEPQQP